MTPPSPDGPETPASRTGRYRRLPGSVWALGFVSLLMDTSSELVHSLLPIFMTTVLGAPVITVGIIEGVAEATAAMTKLFSGVVSDWINNRKILAVVGYALAAFTKPIFPLANTIGWVFGARFVDRIGKGIRGAPRDALVADVVSPQLRGAAYGLRQALDSVGAFLGPLLAVIFMIGFANDIKVVLWIAVVPAFFAVFVLIVAVHEPPSSAHRAASGHRPTLANAKRLPREYWLVVALGAVFTLARFSEAFLILRAQDVGLGIAFVPVIMMVMNLVYAGGAYPAGALADRYPARTLLMVGLMVLVIADGLLAVAASPWAAFLGAAFWGLHMALTQGLLSKLVADTAPTELRGSAFGLFNLVSGVALLFASLIAGLLWSALGASATFVAGALFATLAIMGLLRVRPSARSTNRPSGTQ